MLQWPEQ